LISNKTVLLLGQTFVHCPRFSTADIKIMSGPFFNSSAVGHSRKPTIDLKFIKNKNLIKNILIVSKGLLPFLKD